jgi:hypothetical protein
MTAHQRGSLDGVGYNMDASLSCSFCSSPTRLAPHTSRQAYQATGGTCERASGASISLGMLVATTPATAMLRIGSATISTVCMGRQRYKIMLMMSTVMIMRGKGGWVRMMAVLTPG